MRCSVLLFVFLVFSAFQSFLKSVEGASGDAFGSIDQIYVINLDRRPEKYAITTSQLEKFGIVPCRFSAIDGQKVKVDSMSPIFSRGATGVLLSHLSILRDAMKKKYQVIWVMEDDIKIVRDPHEMEKIVQELGKHDPKWDLLFTDWESKNKQGEYLLCRSVPTHPKIRYKPLSEYVRINRRISKNISQCGPRFGTYSILLSRRGIKKIRKFYKKFGIYNAYDCEMPFIKGIRMYRPNRDIVSTIPDAISDN